jgi:hypothetical protein
MIDINMIGNIIWIIWMLNLLTSYYKIQNKLIEPDSYQFILLNLIWATCMLISLSIHFNLAWFILESIFIWIWAKALYNKLTT